MFTASLLQNADRPTVSIATYPDHAQAQRAVDHLSDSGFRSSTPG